ncbi:unnamed protein product [Rhizopus microsporus]
MTNYTRSTVLDSWTWDQLRLMKVGGNQAASEFFSKSSISTTNDARQKYSSRAGQQYKELLTKRAAEDAIMHPTNVVIDIDVQEENEPPKKEEKKEEEKEVEEKKEPVSKPVEENPPVQTTQTTPTTPTTPKPPTTRTTSTNRTAMGIRAPRKPGKTAKLGVKKAPVNFNFEAAEAQAKQDLERKAKYQEEEEKEETTKDEEGSRKPLSSRLMYQDNNTAREEEYEKLGFGMARLNVSMPEQKPYTEETTSAREKFGSARAISSDQYFGRNEYDPAISAAEQSRLSQFSSAKAISSDMYFGRDSQEVNTNSGHDIVSLTDWDNVQDHAVAMARRIVDQAALDLDAVKDLAENATNKVRSYFNA